MKSSLFPSIAFLGRLSMTAAMAPLHVSLIPPAMGETMSERQAVTVVTARAGVVARTVSVNGSVVARDLVFVKAGLDGLRITAVEAEAGDMITEDQVLVRLDDSMLLVEQAKVAADLQRAEAAILQQQNRIDDAAVELDRLKAEAERSRRLHDKGFLSAETMENSDAGLRRAELALAIERQALELANAESAIAAAEAKRVATELESTRIRAPLPGRIFERNATIGATASGSGDPLFRIAGGGTVEIAVTVSEKDIGEIRAGQTATVTVAGRNQAIPATVRLVHPSVGESNRLGKVLLSVPASTDLPIGMFATAEIEVTREAGIYVPASAVVVEDASSFVQTIDSGLVHRVSVHRGTTIGGLVRILDGVEAGDIVVLRAAGFLREGDAVQPVDTDYTVPGELDETLEMAAER